MGRLVPACLHQAIQETLPRRLDFYEHWLHSQALHDGSIGLAPMTAVLGFLRTEGEGYDQVVRRAGAGRRMDGRLDVAVSPAAARRASQPDARACGDAGGGRHRPRRSSDSHARRHVRRGASKSMRRPSAPFATSNRCLSAVSTRRPRKRPCARSACRRARPERCRAVDGGICVMGVDFGDRHAAVESGGSNR